MFIAVIMLHKIFRNRGGVGDPELTPILSTHSGLFLHRLEQDHLEEHERTALIGLLGMTSPSEGEFEKSMQCFMQLALPRIVAQSHLLRETIFGLHTIDHILRNYPSVSVASDTHRIVLYLMRR